MNGTVIGLNGDRCAVETPEGISILEFASIHSTELGDEVVGHLSAEGMQSIFNKSKGETVSASVEFAGLDRDSASQFLFA